MIRRFVFKQFFLPCFFILLLAGCKKSDSIPGGNAADAEILSFSLTKNNTDQPGFYPNNTIKLREADTVRDGKALAAYFTLSPGATCAVNNMKQVSGSTQNNFEDQVEYVVTAANHTTQKVWHILATNNDYSINYGLGQFVNQSLTEDRPYEWYLDQANTGVYSGLNCGPTSVTMAIKWADSTFIKTPLDARNTYETAGGWWYTNDIDNYLNLYSIPHATVALGLTATATMQTLMLELDRNQVVILCIDMNQMRPAAADAYHVDKFYSTTPNWGHFFVVKGYQIVDGEAYFQVYDPYSFGSTNFDDGLLKGKNRFYRYEDVAAATSVWWNYAIVVAKKGQSVDANTLHRALDPLTIPRAHSF